jgi:hypothetical protein
MPKKSGTYTRYLKDPLLEPYFIQLEDYGFTIHKNIKSDTREYTQKIGHYLSFQNTIQAICRDKVMSNSYNSLKEFLNEYKKVIDQLNLIPKI